MVGIYLQGPLEIGEGDRRLGLVQEGFGPVGQGLELIGPADTWCLQRQCAAAALYTEIVSGVLRVVGRAGVPSMNSDQSSLTNISISISI